MVTQLHIPAYLALLSAFVEGRLKAREFVHIYLTLFKHEVGYMDRDTFDVLQRVFSAADLYRPDAAQGEAFAVAEDELRHDASTALRYLLALAEEE